MLGTGDRGTCYPLPSRCWPKTRPATLGAPVLALAIATKHINAPFVTKTRACSSRCSLLHNQVVLAQLPPPLQLWRDRCITPSGVATTHNLTSQSHAWHCRNTRDTPTTPSPHPPLPLPLKLSLLQHNQTQSSKPGLSNESPTVNVLSQTNQQTNQQTNKLTN